MPPICFHFNNYAKPEMNSGREASARKNKKIEKDESDQALTKIFEKSDKFAKN